MINKENLQEIKRGHTGTGLLIEHDGYISADSPSNKKLREGMRDEEWHCPYPFIVDAVLQRADVKNANGRVYPKKILEREIENYQTRIRERRALGECNHPSDSTIDLGRISHNIIECHWEGDAVVGKLELNISEGYRRTGICSTLGDTCANLILNGYRIGISSRAVGSVENKLGVLMVGDDLELLCWDLVADPSTPLSYLGTEEEVATQFLHLPEGKTTNKNVISEKIKKLKQLL